MPLYEYHCAKCGRFENLQKISDPSLSACPKCGGAVERLISAPAFQFKGSGWYVTDYARSGSEGNASKDAGSKGAETKSSEESGSGSSKEAATPTSADSKSSTNSPPKEGTASAAPALAPAVNTSQ